jgi:hypothetical protein
MCVQTEKSEQKRTGTKREVEKKAPCFGTDREVLKQEKAEKGRALKSSTSTMSLPALLHAR